MTDPQAALMVARIQQLYQVEHVGAALDPDARRALCREQSVPLLAQIDTVRQDLARTMLPKAALFGLPNEFRLEPSHPTPQCSTLHPSLSATNRIAPHFYPCSAVCCCTRRTVRLHSPGSASKVVK
jgi:hypothetical protein